MYVNNLSFDPAHAWFAVPSIGHARFAIEVFTTENVYGLDPAHTTRDGRDLTSTRLQLLGGQRSVGGRVTAAVRRDSDGTVAWKITAEADEPVKGIKLLLVDLPAGHEGWWTPTTAAGVRLMPTSELPVHLAYPWRNPDDHSWRTPWICAGEGPGITLSVRNEEVRATRFYTYLPHWMSGPVVEIVCDASAQDRRNSFETPEIRLRECASPEEIRDDFDAHLAGLERAYGLTRWEARTDTPAWVDELDLVLTLHGQHWTGFVFNTFAEMSAILEDITSDVQGDRVLAYLPGWEGRYYWQYPVYQPGTDLGGADGFRGLVETANRLGVHLMPMLGANGANVNRYPDWKQAAFRSPSDRYVALVNSPDWDNDRAPEDDQIFLNPGEPAFRDHLVAQVTTLVETYGVEGVFLDTSACWFNDPRHDLTEGYRRLVGEIHGRHPELLVCGEGWYDALLAVFPMNQTWIDMNAAPRFDDLPMRYSRVLGHLKDGAPGAGSTGVHEGGINPQAQPLRVNGYVPALGVVHDTFAKHRDDVREFCRAVAKEAL